MQEQSSEYSSFRIPVPQEFDNVFSHFYFAENNSELPVKKTLLPNYQTILLFCFGDSTSLITREQTTINVGKCIVFGPIRKSFEYILPPKTSILVANFKDDAFFRFFGKSVIPYHQPVSPDDLSEENCFTELWHELSDIHPVTEKVAHILRFCKPYLNIQDPSTRLLSAFKDENLNPVKTIAERTNQSERNIQLKHKEHFGYSAKEIHRYNRFLKAIRLIEKSIEVKHKIEWFAIIDQCNYYDQSQLIHDFKHFLQLSPSQYIKFQQDICNPKSE